MLDRRPARRKLAARANLAAVLTALASEHRPVRLVLVCRGASAIAAQCKASPASGSPWLSKLRSSAESSSPSLASRPAPSDPCPCAGSRRLLVSLLLESVPLASLSSSEPTRVGVVATGARELDGAPILPPVRSGREGGRLAVDMAGRSCLRASKSGVV